MRWRRARLRLAAGDVAAAVGVIPCRYAVSPPQLAADAPVLDLVHPLEVHAGPIVRHEADLSRFDGADGRLRQRLDVDEPLIGEQGFEYGVAAIAARHRQLVRLDALDEILRRQVGQHPGARLNAVETAVGGGHLVVERGIRVHDVDQRQSVPLTDLVVVEVVRRRDLDAAAAEGGVHVGIADDGDFTRGQRQAHLPADQVPVALIIGMHGDGRVTQQGFRPGGGDHEKAAAAHQRIAQVPQAAGFLLGDHFQIGQRGLQHRVPVHQTLAAIDESFAHAAARILPSRPATGRDPW